VSLLALVTAGGCGPGSATRELTGKITYAGKVVEKGQIVLVPVDGTKGGSTGGEIEGGYYRVSAEKGPIAGGSYRVEITSMVKSNRTVPNPIVPNGPRVHLYDNDIPEQYNSESTLTISISQDRSPTHDFDLPAVGRMPGA